MSKQAHQLEDVLQKGERLASVSRKTAMQRHTLRTNCLEILAFLLRAARF
ncbi:unnamed protein product [Gemmata massiliana]|uniref:Uncharacterized protein n=1 Tax=Gemmata massiliana TaxID=1210884 RepID=A0A6P2DCV5_9BACT|nr:unnamed protein product [Gemmata massiliana]